jgi:histone acetyltransferase MCC1
MSTTLVSDIISIDEIDSHRCYNWADVEAGNTSVGPIEAEHTPTTGPEQRKSLEFVPQNSFGIAGEESLLRSRSGEMVWSLRYRPIRPTDRLVIQQLHEQWFPVKYVDEFYDELCLHGRMTGSGDPLFSSVAVLQQPAESTNDQHNSSSFPTEGFARNEDGDCIVACVVGCFVRAALLSAKTQDLLVNDVQRHPRLFYIMTVGTVARQAGLGTQMTQQCIEQVQRDPGCGVLYLHVLTNNVAAIRMYERLGFYRVQEIPHYYNIEGQLHPCYLYAMYFHGNRGHRSMYKLAQSTWASLWQRVQSVTTTLWTASKATPTKARGDQVFDATRYEEPNNDDLSHCVNEDNFHNHCAAAAAADDDDPSSSRGQPIEMDVNAHSGWTAAL